MDNRVAPITALRLRLTEEAYRSAVDMLPREDGTPAFVVGLCGPTQIMRKDGYEAVATVFALSSQLRFLSNAFDEDMLWSIRGYREKQEAWPAIFYRNESSKCFKEDLFLQSLSDSLRKPVLAIEINPDDSMTGYFALDGCLQPINTILIPSADIFLWQNSTQNIENVDAERTRRFEQSFGSKTLGIMSMLKVGVIGVSGTGSPVAEMLYRLGVGELILVDDDRIETKNIGRIFNSSMQDALDGRYKVDVLAASFAAHGLPTQVKVMASTTRDPSVIRELAQCDVVFGCMDSESGRALLNRLSTFYLVPYFDLGVNLKADGQGGISVVCGAVHYLKPGGSSLLSRKAISLENIEAEDLKRASPEMYQQQREEKYIKGVQEDRPAVITVNTMVAATALNDFLARIHPYRHNPNSSIGCIRIDLREPEFHLEPDGDPDAPLSRWAGYADMNPLLNMLSFA